MPKMTVTLNALTVPLLEAVMTRNTGHGIDFSRGDGFGQSTSEFVIIRYLIPGTSSIRTARLMRIGRRLPVTALPVMGTI